MDDIQTTLARLDSTTFVKKIRLPDSQLLPRIATYSPFAWFTKPKALSPVNCALHGWTCIDKDTLACDRCSSRYICRLSSSAPPTQVAKYATLLKDSHKKHCPWRLTPVQRHSYRFPVLDASSAQGYLLDAYEKWKEFSIQTTVPLTTEEVQLISRALFKANELPGRTNLSALSLAVFGWETRPNSNRFAECHLCARKVGLWSFFKNSDKEMDVVGEHRWFCAWINPEYGSDGLSGWKVLLACLSRKIKDVDEDLQVQTPLDVYRLMERILPVAR